MKLNVKALVLTASLVWAGSVLMVGVANLICPGYGMAFLHIVKDAPVICRSRQNAYEF
jgi:hypothetical protein